MESEVPLCPTWLVRVIGRLEKIQMPCSGLERLMGGKLLWEQRRGRLVTGKGVVVWINQHLKATNSFKLSKLFKFAVVGLEKKGKYPRVLPGVPH